MGRVKELMMEYCEVVHPDDFDAQDALFVKIMETGEPKLEVMSQIVQEHYRNWQPRPIIDTYKIQLTQLKKLRERAGENFVVDDDGFTIDDDIKRVETHIHRLETDHADCVEPCCMGCKMGGRKDVVPPD